MAIWPGPWLADLDAPPFPVRLAAAGNAAGTILVMTDRPDARPSAAARFSWHPEPGLIGIDDAATSRAALEALGREAWAAGLDYLFGEAFRRAMGEPTAYTELRRTFFGWTPDGATDSNPGPAPAPTGPTTSSALLD